jgi:cysteine synthase
MTARPEGQPAPQPDRASQVATPLVATRSLGRLMGIEWLAFKLETAQPTGSWLDRGAQRLVQTALAAGVTGLGAVGSDPMTLPLAVQCARVGLRLVVVVPGEDEAARRVVDRSGEVRWLRALGAAIIPVEADHQALHQVAPDLLRQAGLRPATQVDLCYCDGLNDLIGEIEEAGHAGSLLVMPELTGHERRWLAAAASERLTAVPLPLDIAGPARAVRPFAVVGALDGPGTAVGESDDGRVVRVAVSRRDAEAARRLLAREEGLLVSLRGAAGFAGLVRAVREDRERRLRERRFRDLAAAVVVLTDDFVREAGGPTPSADAVPERPMPLAALADSLARLLVRPPGRA